MEFRILGPLEIVDGTRTVSIRTGNDRAVLALLLLRANETVSTARLIDELWRTAPPPTAAKILQSCVSRLRRELEPDRIETRGHGYVLHLEPDELDATRFERLVQEGRQREALALWRGPPFADLDDHPFAVDAARHLAELRIGALEERIDEDIAAGRAARVVAELEALTRELPFRERLHGHLMRALYADGRQKEALEAYRRARRSLSEELGLEPGPELQELERAILRHDPTLPRVQRSRRRPRRRVAVSVAVAATAVAATVAVASLRETTAPIVPVADSVVAIDPSSNRIADDVRLGAGSQPGQIAVGGGAVWVTNAPNRNVVRIDAATGRVAETYDVDGAAADVALDRAGAWIVTGNDDVLFHVRPDGATTRIALPPSSAGAFAVATGGGSVWIAGNMLLKIDEATGALAGRGGGSCCSPIDVAFVDGSVWVAGSDERVTRFGARSLKPIGDYDLGELDLRLAGAGESVWAAGTGSFGSRDPSVVWELGTRTGLTRLTVPLGQPATSRYWSTAIAVGAGAVWVAIADDRAVYRLDPGSGRVVARIATTRPPYAVAVGAGRVWVSVR